MHDNSNMNLSTNDSTFLCRRSLEIAAIGVVHMCLCLLGVLGNTAVIAAILKCRKLRDEPSNLFLMNLAVTDLCTAAIVMGSTFVALVADYWPFGQIWCDLVCMVNYLFIIVSMLTLCLISIDRYQAIYHPLRYNEHVTRKKVLLGIAYTWIQGVAISAVPVVLRWIEYDYWEVVCAIQWYKHQQKAVYYVIFAFVSCFLIPGFILGFSYCKVVIMACRKKKIHIHTNQWTPESYSVSSRAINSLLIVVIMYFVCMTPFSATKLYNVIMPKDNPLPRYTYLIASMVAYLSSAVNPLIYGLLRKDFKEAFGLLTKRISQTFLNIG